MSAKTLLKQAIVAAKEGNIEAMTEALTQINRAEIDEDSQALFDVGHLELMYGPSESAHADGLSLYRRASQLGHAGAKLNLACFARTGSSCFGIEKNISGAISLYREVLELDHATNEELRTALSELAGIYGDKGFPGYDFGTSLLFAAYALRVDPFPPARDIVKDTLTTLGVSLDAYYDLGVSDFRIKWRTAMTAGTGSGPTPEAAVQFAEALINSIEYAGWDETLASYWQEKLLILSRLNHVPRSYLAALMKDCDSPAVIRLFQDGISDQENRRVTTSVKMALSAAVQNINPFQGVLAYTAPPEEREFWRTHANALMKTVALYRQQSRELLAGLLAIAMPALNGTALPDDVLVERGLPKEEPRYDP